MIKQDLNNFKFGHWPPFQNLLRKFSPLGSSATIVVLVVSVPLIFIIYSSLQLSQTQWVGLWSSRLPGLMWNTLALAALVAMGSFVLGVSAAWWVGRHDFPGRKMAVWLMVLPLTIPTYVFANIYINLLEDDGWLGSLWIGLFGNQWAVPDIFNIFGASFILSMAGFSYVFLLARSALSVSSRSMEEAARIQGATPYEVFWRINLPLLRPAIAAGLALVVLHVLSDFGAVSLLHFQTFTLSIYLQMSGRFDYQSAAGLSLILVLLSMTFLTLERFFRNRQRYYGLKCNRQQELLPTSRLTIVLIWIWLGAIASFSFLLPLAWMISWSLEAFAQNLIDNEFWGYAINSLMVAVVAASIAVVVALPVAFYHARKRSFVSSLYLHLSSVGFVLPGPVIALGILSFVISQLPLLYGGLTALVLAMVIRYLPLAVQSQDAALQQFTPSIEEAGRILGAGPFENLRRVILPMIKGGLASAWVLVFIDTLKELPATLILRPTGFDTLPIRIWIEASEEMLELAAPSALMLVVGTLPIIWILMKETGRGEHGNV